MGLKQWLQRILGIVPKHKHRWTRWIDAGRGILPRNKKCYVKFCKYPGCKTYRMKFVKLRRGRRKKRRTIIR